MKSVETLLATIFWASVLLVSYAYLAYPVMLWCFARTFGRRSTPLHDREGELPVVSLLIAAHNEQEVIDARMRNALAMDYPPTRLEVVVGSDGSSDDTPNIVRRFCDRGVRLLEYPQRQGKAGVLNSAFGELHGEIIILSDANTDIEPQAARNLVRWFKDPTVGIVCGRLILSAPEGADNMDSVYWRHETFLKQCEGCLDAVLGANGAIYAIRRDLYVPIPSETIVDDFVIPLLAKQRTGCRIIFDPEAIAFESTPLGIGAEFSRRTRIGTGGFQAIGMLWRLLDPRRGWIAFSFLSHKLLRWICPFLLVAMLASSALLAHLTLYRWLLAGQCSFYLLSALGLIVQGSGVASRFARLTSMFTAMNLALLVGFVRWSLAKPSGVWQRTPRS